MPSSARGRVMTGSDGVILDLDGTLGDAPWDAIAARRAGAIPLAVRCEGFGDRPLREAGVERILDVPALLVGQL